MQKELVFFSFLIQVTAALLSLFYLHKFKSDFYKVLVIILCLTAFIELLGFNNVKIGKSGENLYLLYGFLLFNLIPYLYLKVLKIRKKNLLIIILSATFNILMLFVLYGSISLNYLIILGSINSSIYVFQYLRELLMSDKILNYKKLLSFWVSVGFLVFYLPSIPFFSMLNYMHTRGLFFVLYILIILMNTFIIYGLLCSKKEEKF
ncbi:hypothetical protein DS884_16790 [Tenacibaculum sp. E3R01]|uniref:hypothetical protein n=1 Tax=Tenacibaculum sp. E3R01 TaxID=2267227 RepID=UPI000DE93242|nr:hypothetical protein [Tenacibaculum sp. E3R01]RBW55285.1 hypothetical protein DS884_16790 [Tenacibaculum sp. E3R01]